jgi:poly-beta-1,6-N-acetyl-D-glucosamine N-deacetylase
MKKNLRNVIAFPLAKFLVKFGFVNKALKKAKEGKFILSVYFHNPSKEEFEKTIVWLKSHNFKFLSPKDLEDIIEKKVEFPKGAVLITADDGWQTNEENMVKVADKHRVPVTIFCSTQAIEEGTYWWSYFLRNKNNSYPTVKQLKKVTNEKRMETLDKLKQSITLEREAMTVDQVKRAAKSPYVTLGAHTHTHPILTRCGDEQVYEEIKTSKDKMEEWLGHEVQFFAYPNGNYGEREIRTLEKLNFKLAFANEPKYLTPETLERMEIPRFGFLEGASFEENMCRIAGIWHSTTRKIRRSS